MRCLRRTVVNTVSSRLPWNWGRSCLPVDTHCFRLPYVADDWKLQATNVCFGAKDDSYGNFTLKHTGTITKLKLKHTGEEATLNCDRYLSNNVGSRWGCYSGEKLIVTAITDKNNTLIIPNSNPLHHYSLPGYHGNSTYLQFDYLNISARCGDELRIWYLQDLRDYTEFNNEGRSCTDVHAVFHD